MYNIAMKRISQKEREVQIINRANELGHEFVGWVDGHRNKDSKLIIRCHKHGEWNPMLSNYIRNGRCRQCVVDSNRLQNPEERIKSSLPSHIKFDGFVDGYKNQSSKVFVHCELHGRSKKSVTDIINKNSFCKKCGTNIVREIKKLGESEASERIEAKCKKFGYRFIGFIDGYKNRSAEITLSCSEHGEWTTKFVNFIDSRKGCPDCGKHGYAKSKDGYLYILRSSCGMHMKIGITNDPDTRLKELSRCTPFDFQLIEIAKSSGIKIHDAEIEMHKKFDSSNMKGFNGATEWFIWDEMVIDLFKQL